jgi:hypothetical protein
LGGIGTGVWTQPAPWATPPALFCDEFFEIGAHKLFAQAGFKLWYSWVVSITGLSHWLPARAYLKHETRFCEKCGGLSFALSFWCAL